METSAQLTQVQREILTRLIAAGEKGINSRYSTLRHKYVQLPARIWELIHEKGFSIGTLPSRNKSVNYVLLRVPKAYRSDIVDIMQRKPSFFTKAIEILRSKFFEN